MRPNPIERRFLGCAAAALALVLLASCAGTSARPPGAASRGPQAPEPDSITTGLWHFDETGGTRAVDSGPFRLDGTAGLDTRTDFGRVRSARVFTRSVESFVYVPYSPAMESGDGLTIEAWVRLDSVGVFTDTPIAARWSPQADQQSWVFAVVGIGDPPDYRPATLSRPRGGTLEFAFVTEEAGPPRVFLSAVPLEAQRWTHVAVTYDGEVVRFFVDGRPDAQYATRGRLRRSDAPLVIGNLLDPRGLSSFGGDLRAAGTLNVFPGQAFVGLIDELRLSNAARREIDAGH